MRFQGCLKPLMLMASCVALSSAYAAAKPLHLTMKQAIMLALRDNPTVRNAELSRVTQKFQLLLDKWNFEPKYQFSMSRNWAQSKSFTTDNGSVYGNSKYWQASPSVSLNTPIGTKINVASANKWGGGGNNFYNPSVVFTVTQPLLKGFGRAIVEQTLEDAYDTEKINKLTLKGTIAETIGSVVTGYIGVIKAQTNLKVDEDALQRAKLSLKQTEIYIKAGQRSESDKVESESQVASQASQIQEDKANIDLLRYQLLQIIGLKPDANIVLSSDIPLNLYHMPSLEKATADALANNPTYQESAISIAILKRALVKARDDQRWQLDLKETYTTGGGSGGGKSGGVRSLYNGSN